MQTPFKQKSPVKLDKTPQTVVHNSLVNHICFILDRSGSMLRLRDDVVRAFDQQVETIRAQAKKTGQETRVSLITFSHQPDDPVFFNAPIDELGKLNRDSYFPDGQTALLDAVGDTLQRLQAIPGANNAETSFLMIVMTDGEENNSRRWDWFRLGEYIKQLNATDRWTFTFLVPPYCRMDLAGKLYIHAGNIQKWDQTTEGVEKAAGGIICGTQSYYEARSRGATAVKSFFSPDLSGVSPADLKKKLHNVSDQYVAYRVSEVLDIRAFVESKGHHYIPGNAFYQLTKKEDVQAHKGFCIRDASGKIFEGNEAARQLMGLPAGGTIVLYPSKDQDRTIFVQSTSFNRKLMPGTVLLYKR